MTKVFTIDGSSYFEFTLKEVEYRLPSICINLVVHNRGFSASLPVYGLNYQALKNF